MNYLLNSMQVIIICVKKLQTMCVYIHARTQQFILNTRKYIN